jgi:cytochrome c-type biogenesis protein CcmH
MLWALLALLTGLTIFAVLRPLAKSPPSQSESELAVSFYNAQLAEIDREVERGLVSAADAETAKAEAARRLLAVAMPSSAREAVQDSRFAVRAAAVFALIAIPAVALGLYGRIGNPQLPDQPLAARLEGTPQNLDINAAIARVEAHLATHPEDGRGYEVLAPAYLKIGRVADAVRAYEESLRLLGETPERRARYGEALVLSANGMVTEAARIAFEKALASNPRLAMAQFYLGLAAEQEGDKARAVALWSKLLAESPANAPWRPNLLARLEALTGTPPQEKMQENKGEASALASMPEEQRAAINQMVERLAARLAESGDDVEGWLRLVRAYKVLDRSDKAKAALVDARRHLNTDAEALTRLNVLARELGLES